MFAKKYLGGALLAASLLPTMAFSAEQSVSATPANFEVEAGDTVSFQVVYPNSNPNDATGMGLSIYYDSTKLTPAGGGVPVNGLTTLSTDKLQGAQALADTSNGDADAATDSLFLLAWAATSQFDPVWNPLGETLVTVTFTASAGFTADTAINFTGAPAAGNTFSGASVPVNLKVVVVPDTAAPVVTAPADVTTVATGATTPVALGAATANDVVDGALTPTADNTGPFPVGATTVTWTATDAAGNMGTDTQIVTITAAPDTTPPVVTPGADITVTSTTANLPAAAAISATATDAVDGALTPTASNSGPFPAGTTTVVWTATDAAGNAGTANQVVTVIVDNVAPPPVDEADPTTPTEDGASVIQTVDDAPFDPATAEPGTYIVTYVVVDAAGNVSPPVELEVVIAPRAITPENIPTLSEWALILLTMMLALVSFVSTRRKNQGRQF